MASEVDTAGGGVSERDYYRESYENVRPSVPRTTTGKYVTAGILIAVVAFTVQALLPAGTPPNSIEPWIGPLPFSFAWLFFWAIFLQAMMIVAYVKLTGEPED